MLHWWMIYLPSPLMNRVMPQTNQSDSESHVRKRRFETLGLLHEMIRSFVTLAQTLNLSHAVKELGSTRQTVRRHIAQLEEVKGVRLFSLEDRQYHLTEAGRQALPEALDILMRGNSWLMGHVSHYDGLQRVHAQLP